MSENRMGMICPKSELVQISDNCCNEKFTQQVVEDGYEFFGKRQLVTLFSAPNFCGEFDNAGALMAVDESLMCSFQILKPSVKKAKYRYQGLDKLKLK